MRMFKPIQFPCGQGIAIINKGESYSYSDLNALIAEKSTRYKGLGLYPGCHVGLHLKDPFSLFISYVALWNQGATIILLDSQLNTSQVSSMLKNAEAHFIFSDHDSIQLNDFSAIDSYAGVTFYGNVSLGRTLLQNKFHENKGFVILFTSGSEGTPKAVTLKKSAILNNVAKVRGYLNLAEQDSTLVSLPLSYSYAMSQTLAHLMSGGKVIFEGQVYLVDNIIHMIAHHGISNYAATPYFYQSLHSSLTAETLQVSLLSHLKFFMNAGGYLNPDIIKYILHALGHIQFYNNYGQTEASPRLSYGKFSAESVNCKGVGMPLPGVQIKIESDPVSGTGEILYKSEDIMLGYYGAFDEELQHKWIRTGDTGTFINGQLYISGRKDSMVKINGRKVHINLIEDLIYGLGFIKHIKLSKEHHDSYGEYLVAHIIPKDRNIPEREFKKAVREFIRKRLSPCERPQKILITQDIQLSTNGKIIHESKVGGLS
jgi:long-chain acyl-CoA synthetase